MTKYKKIPTSEPDAEQGTVAAGLEAISALKGPLLQPETSIVAGYVSFALSKQQQASNTDLLAVRTTSLLYTGSGTMPRSSLCRPLQLGRSRARMSLSIQYPQLCDLPPEVLSQTLTFKRLKLRVQ